MKKIKVDFSKLVGSWKHSIGQKMEIFNWMLKTGKGHDFQYGWYRDGINKSLLGYSANNHDRVHPIPSPDKLHWFFDAVFARAVFSFENQALKTWRKKESIYPGKFRMLSFNDGIPDNAIAIPQLIWKIMDMDGKELKKEAHHPGYKDRTEPKILGVAIYTVGNGWTVQYTFSFKETEGSSWTKRYRQCDDESVWQFLQRAYEELCLVLKQ